VNPAVAAWGAAVVVEGAIVEAGPYPGELKPQPMRVRADAVYKGAPAPGSVVDVSYLHCNTAPLQPAPTRSFIWFLAADERGLWTHLCALHLPADEQGRALAHEAIRLSARVTAPREPGTTDPNTPEFVLRVLALGWRLAALEQELAAATRGGTAPPDGTALFEELRAATGVGYARLPGASPRLVLEVVGRVGWETPAAELLLSGARVQGEWRRPPPDPADPRGSRPANRRAAASRRAVDTFVPVWGAPAQVEPLLRAVCTSLADAPCDAARFDPNVR
jgi:hypothetical protein